MSGPLEIERKYLIEYPDLNMLKPLCSNIYRIEQTYLNAPPELTRRVRHRVGDKEEFFYTEKERISDVTCVEREKKLSKQEYQELLTERKEGSITIAKWRYCVPYNDLVFEIDVYDFWQSVAIMEVELSSEAQTFSIPPFITVLREVTHDWTFKNAALAKFVPNEKSLL